MNIRRAGPDADFWNGIELKKQRLYGGGQLKIPPEQGPADGVVWRQSAEELELWVPLPDTVKVKRHCKVAIKRSSLSMRIVDGETSTLVKLDNAPLLRSIDPDESSWFIEEDSIPRSVDTERWLVVSLKKDDQGKFFNWKTVFEGLESTVKSSLAIGLGGDLSVTTAEQIINYQRIEQQADFLKADVYVRAEGGELCYYCGKVATSPGISLDATIEAQELLIIGHVQFLLPGVFGSIDSLELLYAPGDSEMLVAQDQQSLKPVDITGAAAVESPMDVGFYPEILDPDQRPFKVKRDPAGAPLGAPFQASMISPEEAEVFTGLKAD